MVAPANSAAEIGFAEDLETHVVECRARLFDVVDVHCHGGAISWMHDQGVGVVNVDLGLQQGHTQVGERLRDRAAARRQ